MWQFQAYFSMPLFRLQRRLFDSIQLQLQCAVTTNVIVPGVDTDLHHACWTDERCMKARSDVRVVGIMFINVTNYVAVSFLW